MTKDWKNYALHILDCINKIELIISKGHINEDGEYLSNCVH